MGLHEAEDSGEMFSDLDEQSNDGNRNANYHAKPRDNEDVLVQNVLTHLANEFVFIGDDVLNVLRGLVYLAERE